MNNRYIDFAPRKSQKTVTSTPILTQKIVKSSATTVTLRPATKPAPAASRATTPILKTAPKATPKVAPVKPVAKPVAKPAKVIVEETLEVTAKTFAPAREPRYGVIEDYSPAFIAPEVEKRPLSTPRKPDAAVAKAQKIRTPLFNHGKKAPAAPVKPAEKEPEFATFKTPKTPFIASAKVEKRPLSKNVYQKPIATPEEEPSGPVTIINKPEKDAHVGLIIAIILTIILGAALGTAAFLLLPKK